ncbi:putative LRR receptor-like serine/threonine-protein kinase [Camellia lanceoleosa]|uniref:LRR receptor-like serine/threonine-protein kinase n=1 Tax=Camellia lanceoleosa TaxID=1840588 RepID=A0ACC0IRB6_9ERIC|nr:putative LRR receptor-like serine/threonine-protein kinase [Camellia lanceoleosa]
MAYNSYHMKAMTVFSLIMCIALPSSTSSFVCENFTDCISLLKFKEGITSDPDGHLQTWNTSTSSSLCNWTGITCHPQLQNRVIALQLINMGLQGQVSPYISNLSFLTTLSLQENSFYGNIPTTLGELSQLKHVNMSINQLKGNIPDELFQLKNLTYLALAVNGLTGILPDSLSNLTELTDLVLAVNYFNGKIPEGLGALTKLEIMNFHTNDFQGTIPASISNCTALREIALLENLLTGDIPSELGAKLYNLEKLYFLNNQLTGRIPVTLSNLSHLTLLDLSLNKLSGEVPLELGKLQKLEILYLHSNDLVSNSNNSFLMALSNCSFLQKLHLGSCLLAESLPTSIGRLSKDLYYFNIRNNRMTGNIPEGIGNLSGLVSLYLWGNQFSGTIPVTVGRLGQLQRLYLNQNKLMGPIPDDMGQMTNLGLLDLGANMISGSIPLSLGRLTQLRYLYLSHNLLSGIIPTELVQSSNLMLLDLSFNNLNGYLPTEIGLLRNLTLSLILSINKLEGKLPESIGNLASVLAIDLRSSLMGNAGLCGGSQILGLPPCEVAKRKHKTRKWVYYVLAISLSCMLLLIMLIAISVRHRFFKNETKEQLMVPLGHRGTHTLTQRELEIATDGFDEANLLGRGSFGSVYKAIIDEGKTVVAVKVLQECSQSHRNLKRECQILSEIRHRNLVKMIADAAAKC